MTTQNSNYITCVKTHNQKDFEGGKYKYIKYDSLLEREEIREVTAETAAFATRMASAMRVQDVFGQEASASTLYVLDRKVLNVLEKNEGTKKFVEGKKVPHSWGIVCDAWTGNENKKYEQVRGGLVGKATGELGKIAVTGGFKKLLLPKIFESELENIADREKCEVDELDRGAMIGAKRRAEGMFIPLSWKLAEILSELEHSWNSKIRDEERRAAKAAAAKAAADANVGLRANVGLFAGALTGNRKVTRMAAEFGEVEEEKSSAAPTAAEALALGALTGKPARGKSRGKRGNVGDVA